MKQTEIEQKQMLDLLNAQIESASELVKLANRIKQIANGITPKTVLTDEDEEGWWINEDGWVGLHKKGQKEHVVAGSGNWITCCRWLYNGHSKSLRKATPEEVEPILTKVAEGMGFKVGVKINPLSGGSSEIRDLKLNYIKYYPEQDDLQMHGCRIYRNGQWATIVSQPKPHEMIKGKWYVLNEPLYGDWLIKFDEYRPDGIYAIDSFPLNYIESRGSGYFSNPIKSRDLTPEEEAKYAHLMPDKVTVGGYEVKVYGLGVWIDKKHISREVLFRGQQLIQSGLSVTLHGETMTTEKLQKLIDLIDKK